MNDSYVELLVKRKTNLAALIGRNILIGIGALSILLMFVSNLGMIALLIAVAMGLAAYICNLEVNTEYEYLYLDKTFSVDKIRNQTSRKKMAEYKIEDMEVLAPATSHHLDAYNNRGDIKTIDYSSGQKEEPAYIMVIKHGNTVKKLIIEMNDELYKQIRMNSPRKVFND